MPPEGTELIYGWLRQTTAALLPKLISSTRPELYQKFFMPNQHIWSTQLRALISCFSSCNNQIWFPKQHEKAVNSRARKVVSKGLAGSINLWTLCKICGESGAACWIALSFSHLSSLALARLYQPLKWYFQQGMKWSYPTDVILNWCNCFKGMAQELCKQAYTFNWS